MRASNAARGAAGGLAACAVSILAAGCQQTVMFEQAGLDGGGSDGSGGGLPDAAAGFCAGGQPQILTFSVESPDVIVVLDRSQAMDAPFGGTTGLAAARKALGDVVMSYQAVVRFGSIQFPGSSNGCFDSAGCCPAQVNFPTLSGYIAFESDLALCDTPQACVDTSQRPTAAALDGGLQVFTRFEQNVPGRYVLLVTDGAPGCASNGGSGACSDAVSEVSMLTNNGVSTVLVGLGDPSPDDCLGNMAQRAGSRFVTPFYASTPTELGTMLSSIARTIATDACHLDVKSAPSDPARVSLFQNGVQVPRNDPDGWDFDRNSPYRITLSGKACDTLLMQGAQNTYLYGCGGQVRP